MRNAREKLMLYGLALEYPTTMGGWIERSMWMRDGFGSPAFGLVL
jgi:hypothetical protein